MKFIDHGISPPVHTPDKMYLIRLEWNSPPSRIEEPLFVYRITGPLKGFISYSEWFKTHLKCGIGLLGSDLYTTALFIVWKGNHVNPAHQLEKRWGKADVDDTKWIEFNQKMFSRGREEMISENSVASNHAWNEEFYIFLRKILLHQGNQKKIHKI